MRASVRGSDARSLALRVLVRSDIERVSADSILGPLLARTRLDSRDRRLVTMLVRTVHRWRGRADAVLDARLTKGLRSLDPVTLNVLRIAYVQLFHMDQIPPHAAVHTAVDTAWKNSGPGKARLVNSVLRGLLARRPGPWDWKDRRPVERLAAELSHPVWLIERWLRRWDAETVRRVCEWNNGNPELHLRLSPGAERAKVEEALRAEGLTVHPGAVLPEALRVTGNLQVARHPLVLDGKVTVQDESQMMVAKLLGGGRGPVADVCAAPGTKTAQLASESPDALIVAMDAKPRRLRKVVETARRLDLENVQCVSGDATRPPLRGALGRVLVDAPCTSLGVLRRRPDARWLRSPGEIPDAASLERQILQAASGLVAPGGLLLYSVCTLEPEETDEVVEDFLSRNTDFSRAQLPEWVPEEVRAGEGTIRVIPGTLGMEGLFACLMRRTQ